MPRFSDNVTHCIASLNGEHVSLYISLAYFAYPWYVSSVQVFTEQPRLYLGSVCTVISFVHISLGWEK